MDEPSLRRCKAKNNSFSASDSYDFMGFFCFKKDGIGAFVKDFGTSFLTGRE